MCDGPVRQQQFKPQASEPITPLVNRLPPKIKTSAKHSACRKIDLLTVDGLFIVNYHTKYHIVLSIKELEKIAGNESLYNSLIVM
jgi:hypothetical protein